MPPGRAAVEDHAAGEEGAHVELPFAAYINKAGAGGIATAAAQRPNGISLTRISLRPNSLPSDASYIRRRVEPASTPSRSAGWRTTSPRSRTPRRNAARRLQSRYREAGLGQRQVGWYDTHARAPVIRRPSSITFGFVAFELAGDVPVIDDGDAVAQRHQLVQVLGDQQYGATAGALASSCSWTDRVEAASRPRAG